jgi:hypothetical protein
MFHTKEGLFFEAVGKDKFIEHYVRVIATSEAPETHVVDYKVTDVNNKVLKNTTLTLAEFASVIASMSMRGESSETYEEAIALLKKAPRK